MFKFFNKKPVVQKRVHREPDFMQGVIRTRQATFNTGANIGPGIAGSLASDLSTYFSSVSNYGGISQAGRTRHDLYLLRNASRQILREHSLGSRYHRLMKRNVVARDISHPRFDGGLDQTLADDISNAWADWWSSDQVFIDSRHSGVSVERQLLGSVIEDGDVLVQTMMVGGDLKLKHYTGDQFYETGTSTDRLSSAQYMGVILNSDSRPEAYMMHENIEHNDANYLNPRSGRAIELDANNCLHIYDPQSAKQYRGIPWVTPVITRIAAIKNFDTYSSTTMQLLSKITGVLHKESKAGDSFGGKLGGGGDDIVDEDEEGAPILGGRSEQRGANPINQRLEISPNTILDLPEGVKLEYPAPDVPTDTIRQYRDELIHEVCVGLELDYATFMGNYEKTNFAGGRMGIINNREMYKDCQIWWTQELRIKIFKKWLAVYEGRLFRRLTGLERDIVMKPTFTGPRWDWVDPVKDTTAMLLNMKEGLMSPQEITRQRGLKLDTVLKEIVAANEKAKQMGLNIDFLQKEVKKENTAEERPEDDEADKKVQG